MANETSNDLSGAINGLVETVTKLAQQQVEVVTNGITAATAVFEPLSKSSVELFGNVLNAGNQLLQNISGAILPKK